MKYTSSEYGKFWYFDVDCIGSYISSGHFWDPCLKPYLDELKPGETFVDVGANFGFFPVYMGKRGVLYHAFEASPELCEVMKMNLTDNDVTSLGMVYCQALYSEERDLVLHRDWRRWCVAGSDKLDYENSWNSGWLALVPEEIGDNFAKYHALPLDKFGIPNVKLLKVDVQGCDLRVLEGARKTISIYRPTILFEFEDFVSVVHGDTWDKYEKFLCTDLNYKITRIGNVEWVGRPL